MNIAIIAGGSGSHEIQRGLAYLTASRATFSVLINCYDNGRSTRLARRWYNVLGPADLKKNQIYRHSLMYKHSQVPGLLNRRFNANSPRDVRRHIDTWTHDLKQTFPARFFALFEALSEDLFQKMAFHRIESLSDFNYTDIIYGYLAQEHGSMTGAAHQMAEILEIPSDSVLINSNDNLYLHALTTRDRLVDDEETIVFWGDASERINDVYLVDANGIRCVPTLDLQFKSALEQATIVVISCGTQWSSLIPTYLTDGFDVLLKGIDIPIYLVMNNVQDLDMMGLDSIDVLNTISRALSLKEYSKLTVVYNELAASPMRRVHPDYRNVVAKLSDEQGATLHNGPKLVEIILNHYASLPTQ